MKLVAFRTYPDMDKKYEMQGFLTPSKKVELYSERLQQFGYDPLPVYREPAESPVSQPELAQEYPLILIAGTKLEAYTHSMMRNIPGLRRHTPENLVELHPETASKLEIHDGEVVNVASPRGSIQCQASMTDTIDPRVVHLYHGFKESNCNVLTDHTVFDPITGSVGMKSLLCKIVKA
jgi:anaerobic selenocysteine-containing dehydrogenase